MSQRNCTVKATALPRRAPRKCFEQARQVVRRNAAARIDDTDLGKSGPVRGHVQADLSTCRRQPTAILNEVGFNLRELVRIALTSGASSTFPRLCLGLVLSGGQYRIDGRKAPWGFW